MIANRATAEKLFQAAFDAYCGIDDALSQIAPDLLPTELAACKHAVGQVMGTILCEVTEPILKQHAELLPEVWRDVPKG